MRRFSAFPTSFPRRRDAIGNLLAAAPERRLYTRPPAIYRDCLVSRSSSTAFSPAHLMGRPGVGQETPAA